MSDPFATVRCRLVIEPSPTIRDATAEVWLLLLAKTAVTSSTGPTGRSDLFRADTLVDDRDSGSKRPTSLELEARLLPGTWVLAAAAVVVERPADRGPKRPAPGRRGKDDVSKRAAPSAVDEFAERLGIAMSGSGFETASGSTFPGAGIVVREPAADTLLAEAEAGVAHIVLADRVSEMRLRRDRAFRELAVIVAAGRGRPPALVTDPTPSPGAGSVVVASGLAARLVGASFGTEAFDLDVDLSPRRSKGDASVRLRGRIGVEVRSGLSAVSEDRRGRRRPVLQLGSRGSR